MFRICFTNSFLLLLSRVRKSCVYPIILSMRNAISEAAGMNQTVDAFVKFVSLPHSWRLGYNARVAGRGHAEAWCTKRVQNLSMRSYGCVLESSCVVEIAYVTFVPLMPADCISTVVPLREKVTSRCTHCRPVACFCEKVPRMVT